MLFLVACSDVRKVYGHVECDEGTSTLLLTAEVQMRTSGVSADTVGVEAMFLGVTRAEADLALDEDRPKLDTWLGRMPADTELITCGTYRDACYLFTATDDAGLKVAGLAENEAACQSPTYDDEDGGDGSGSGGGDDCYGTLVCNDGTVSCTCNTCSAGCCSNHDGCD